jgi:hypothetical protein
MRRNLHLGSERVVAYRVQRLLAAGGEPGLVGLKHVSGTSDLTPVHVHRVQGAVPSPTVDVVTSSTIWGTGAGVSASSSIAACATEDSAIGVFSSAAIPAGVCPTPAAVASAPASPANTPVNPLALLTASLTAVAWIVSPGPKSRVGAPPCCSSFRMWERTHLCEQNHAYDPFLYLQTCITQPVHRCVTFKLHRGVLYSWRNVSGKRARAQGACVAPAGACGARARGACGRATRSGIGIW